MPLSIQGTISSASSAINLIKEIYAAKSALDGNSRLIELQQIMMDIQASAFQAQSEQAACAQEVRDLKEKLMQIENWETEKKRYSLTQINRGRFVYALEEEMSEGEPPHYICANCYQVGRKSILQRSGTVLMCVVCKINIPLS